MAQLTARAAELFSVAPDENRVVVGLEKAGASFREHPRGPQARAIGPKGNRSAFAGKTDMTIAPNAEFMCRLSL